MYLCLYLHSIISLVHKLATLTADKNCKKLMPDMKRHHTLHAKSHASILA